MSFSCPDLTFSWTRTIFEAYRHSMAPLRWKGCHQWKRVSLYISSYIPLWTTACWQNYHVIFSLNDIKLRYQPGRGAGTWGSGNSVGRWRRWWQGGENNERIALNNIIFMMIVCLHSFLSLRCLLYLAFSQFCAAFVAWCGPRIIVRLEVQVPVQVQV